MALSDYVPECRQVKVDGKVIFSVEAISLDTLAALVKTHFPDLEHVFEIVLDGEKDNEALTDQMQRIALGLASRAPGLLANIIAVCSTEEFSEQLVKNARRLPFPIQVEAMMQIGGLTFEEAGGVKKAIESLMVLMARMRTKPMRQPAPVDPTIPTSLMNPPSTVSTSAFAVT